MAAPAPANDVVEDELDSDGDALDEEERFCHRVIDEEDQADDGPLDSDDEKQRDAADDDDPDAEDSDDEWAARVQHTPKQRFVPRWQRDARGKLIREGGQLKAVEQQEQELPAFTHDTDIEFGEWCHMTSLTHIEDHTEVVLDAVDRSLLKDLKQSIPVLLDKWASMSGYVRWVVLTAVLARSYSLTSWFFVALQDYYR
jgi:hypothetical protein